MNGYDQTMRVLLRGVFLGMKHAAPIMASDDSSFVNSHALIVDGGLIGGRVWSVVQEQRQQLRAALGIGA